MESRVVENEVIDRSKPCSKWHSVPKDRRAVVVEWTGKTDRERG